MPGLMVDSQVREGTTSPLRVKSRLFHETGMLVVDLERDLVRRWESQTVSGERDQ